MDEFVCVRIVQCWGLDLSLFQFDFWKTWVIFLMNSEKAIYGRFTARQDSDLEGLRVALLGALELHKGYPANKAELAGKAGIPLPWKTPEEIPAIRDKGKSRGADSRNGCIHCHDVLEAANQSLYQAGKPTPQRNLSPWPTSHRVGVTLDPKERATVVKVLSGSIGEKAGLQAGDKVVRLAGQPLISTADFEWVLWSTEDTSALEAEVDRSGRKLDLTLTLTPGWRGR